MMLWEEQREISQQFLRNKVGIHNGYKEYFNLCQSNGRTE